MPGLLEKVISYADEFDMLQGSGLILACVSGGADSMCLLEALLEISHTRSFTVGAVHYNHMLRGEESLRDEVFVRDYCAAHNVPFFSGSGDVRAHANKYGIGIEEAARNMRYEFFFETAEKTGAEKIVTAHTADDNAETMILNLARGTGTNGLAGIPPVRGRVIRPMLCVCRKDVVNFISERAIPFVEDYTNSLDIFARNRVRHRVIPVIKEINPRFAEAMAATAELSRSDEEYLSSLADQYVKECCVDFSADAEGLEELPIAISGRVIRKLCGGNLSYKHVKAVLSLCSHNNPSASLSLPGMIVYREYGNIIFNGEQKPAAESFAPVYPSDGDSVIFLRSGLKMSCKSTICGGKINKSFTSFLFKYTEICGKMTVRSRREGDTIRFFGQTSTKSLKKLFIERRIPARKRAFIPIIADDEGVLAVYGLGMGSRAIPEVGDFSVKVSFEEIK